jgi:succinyl-CoA synthetase beta subunit
MIGVRDDPRFGPFVVLGLGGVLVEAVRDVAFRLLPLTRADVTDMIKELRGNALFGQYRGSPPRDVDALIEAVMGLSRAYQILFGDISDIEINPLMVGAAGEGVCAVDIRTVARQHQ